MKCLNILRTSPMVLSSAVFFSGAAALALTVASVNAAPQLSSLSSAKEISPYTITDRGPHHRVWSRVTAQTNALGQVHYHTNSYTELATGMNVKKNGKWVEASEEIEITPDGAVAGNGQHQVKFSGNINTANAVELTTPDGKKLKSHILGLSYFDTSTGKSVLIAELKDSHGEVLPTKNQALYPDAFTDFRADVRYTYTLSGFEQDIILREQPPAPAEYGLNPETTHLQVLTEFTDAPDPGKKAVASKRKNSAIDEELDFGAMQMIRGKAFSLGGEGEHVRVDKQWTHLEGRTFLVEDVEVKAIGNELQVLPKPPSSASLNNSMDSSRHKVVQGRELPAPKIAKKSESLIRMVNNSDARKGFVLDYQAVAGTSNNFTFQSDTTYYVTNVFNLTGQTIIEGGTVIKFATNTLAKIVINNTNIVCQTGPYRPAIFTGRDDDTVGTALPDSTGNPTDYYGDVGLKFTVSGGTFPALKYFRFSHLRKAFETQVGFYNLYNMQFVHCQTAFNNLDGTLSLNNALLSDVSLGFYCFPDPCSIILQNVTAHNVSRLCLVYEYEDWTPGSGGIESFSLDTYNTLLAQVDVGAPISTSVASVNLGLDTGLFQTVGAASHYLADDSPYRNAGTTNIDAVLFADLTKKTTYPPLVFNVEGAFWGTSTTLFPQAQRDTDTPDLGYHYDPIDYAFSYTWITNSTITLNPGTVITAFYTTNYGIGGIVAGYGGQFISAGSPTKLNRLVEYNTVQEQSNTNWTGALYSILVPNYTTNGPASVISCRFTDFSIMAQDFPHLQTPGGNSAPVNFQDCQLHGGDIFELGTTLNLTNCLLERVNTVIFSQDGYADSIRNNLFYGGNFEAYLENTNSIIRDNLFDATVIPDDGMGFIASYNGYNKRYATNCDRILPTAPSDILLTNFTYQVGPLGNYYQPTNSALINKGSTLAQNVGLYHYTVLTNQVKEAATTNDIGFHYVAVDGNENPIDSDGDGLADYLEDNNGNGLVDGVETAWNNVDTDYDGINDPEEILDGTDPLNAGSFTPRRLGYWPFDDDSFLGAEGQMPLAFTNVFTVAGWTTNAVEVDSVFPANLTYRESETNNQANINLRSGTVRFRFKPNWTSWTNGTGPLNEGRFIEVGIKDTTNGWWGLMVTSGGNQIGFITQTNGAGRTNLICPVAWNSNQWHQVVLTYGPTNSSLYIDGRPVATNGLGVIHYPNPAVRASTGISVGSDKDGGHQVHGDIDDLETFNYELDSVTIANGCFTINAATPQIVTGEPGQTVGVAYNWFGGPLDTAFSIFTVVIDSTGQVITCSTFQPDPDCTQWTNTTTINQAINIPAQTPAGTYRILAGLSDEINGGVHVPLTMGVGVVASQANDGQDKAYQVGLLVVTNGVSVTISSPLDQSTLTQGTPVTISASSASGFGGVQKLEFFVNGWKQGEVASDSGSVSWTPKTSGNYTITVKATDAYGSSATQRVTVGVGGSVGITINTPVDQQVFSTPGNILISAVTNSSSGITNVSFLANGVLLGTDGTSPFNYNWSNAYSGIYQLQAVGYGSAGAITSAPVSINCNYITVEQVTPSALRGSPGQTVTFAYNFLGGSTFANLGLNLSCVDSNGIVQFGDGFGPNPPTSQWAGYVSFTRSFLIPSNAPAGTYKLMVSLTPSVANVPMMPGLGVVEDALGLHTYQVGTLQVLPAFNSNAPAVTITSPTNGQAISPGSLVSIVADASETPGTVTNVDFYANGVLIGKSTGVPYSCLWSNSILSSYTLTAVAYDTNGVSTTSDSVKVVVHQDGDYDGRSDDQEFLDGTNPSDAQSFLPVQLGSWRFDTTNWIGDRGQAPLVFSNLQSVVTWDTNGVQLDNLSGAILKYRDVEPDGQANINLRNGSIRFWFRPDWNSATTNGGTGPLSDGRLMEVGTQLTNKGWWALIFNTNGTQIRFQTQTNGSATTNLSTTINWTSNLWHQVVLTYCATNSAIYLDGQPIVTNGAGVQIYPNIFERAAGFTIGSDQAGGRQARGKFENLETYNFLLGTSDIASNYQFVINLPNFDSDGDGVPNWADPDPKNLNAGASLVAPNGLISWWPAEWNANDIYGTNDGTFYGFSGNQPGYIGNAFVFSGDAELADFIKIPDSTSLNPSNITVMAWVNVWGNDGAHRKIIGKDGEYSDRQYLLTVNDTQQFRAHVGTAASGFYYGDGATTINDNQWYHVAMTYDGSVLKLYVNGKLDGTFTGASGPIITTTQPVRIGGGDPDIEDYWFFAGLIDEAAIFGRALNAAEIQGIYSAGISGMYRDTDYDGRSDAQESGDHTDAYNASSVTNVMLGSWSFNNTNWLGNQGQVPITVTNLQSISSWSSNALQVDSSYNAILKYRDVETNGFANINLRSGTVRFWFRPDWDSQTKRSGLGPQTEGRLIEMGNQTISNGWWALTFDPNGTNLIFRTATNGTTMTNFVATINWQSNWWHQVALTYSPTSSTLYIDGASVTNGLAVQYYPNLLERADGFTIGSDRDGNRQARGQFDELQTFNYPLSATTITNDYWAVASLDSDGDGLTDVQEAYLGTDPHKFSTDGSGISDGDQDFDHDLLINRLEFTKYNSDPLDPTSLDKRTGVTKYKDSEIRLTAPQLQSVTDIGFSVTAGGGSMTFTLTGTKAGTPYLILSRPSLDPGPWTYFKMVTGTAGTTTYTVTPAPSGFLFFIAGLGTDDDGDGLPALYEVVVTKTSPDLAATTDINDAVADYNENGIDNYHEYILPFKAGIYASSPIASAAGDYGAFTISSPKQAPVGGITMNFSVAGTAVSGTDYTLVNSSGATITVNSSTHIGSITIPQGSGSTTIYVIANSSLPYSSPGYKTLQMSLASCSDGTITLDNKSATVTILESGVPSGVSTTDANPVVTLKVKADDSNRTGGNSYAYAHEPDLDATQNPNTPDYNGQNGVFTVTRTDSDSLKKPLTVYYEVRGTAQNGADYVYLPGAVTIPAGAATAEIVVTPIYDGLSEYQETVVLTLKPDRAYKVGASPSATVYIDDSAKSTPIYTVTVTSPVLNLKPLLTGSIVIKRTGDTRIPRSVPYAFSGSGSAYMSGSLAHVSATAGGVTLSQSGSMSFNGSSVTITLTPQSHAWGTSAAPFAFEDFKFSIGDKTSDSIYFCPGVFVVNLSYVNGDNTATRPATSGGTATDTAKIRFVTTWKSSTGNVANSRPAFDMPYAIAGTAQNGVDYQYLTGTIHVPAGDNTTTDVDIVPLYNGLSLGAKRATITLPLAAYALASGTPTPSLAYRIQDAGVTVNYTLDSDGDGIPDFQEINLYGTDPNKADTDGDGLSDGYEVLTSNTNPLKADTDGDGLPDGYEVNKGWKPLDASSPGGVNADGDGDGLTLLQEFSLNSDPTKTDTFGDGLGDYTHYYLHAIATDSDGDGLTDFLEIGLGTDPSTTTTRTAGAGPTITLTAPTTGVTPLP